MILAISLAQLVAVFFGTVVGVCIVGFVTLWLTFRNPPGRDE